MPDQIIAGHPTHWRELGNGARRVLALHCSLAHGGAWSALGAAMPELRLVAPDLPGHGKSADPETPALGHDTATAMAIGLAEQIGGGEPVDIFGHSYGGTVALRLALARPDLVRSLVLIEPVVFAVAADWSGYADFRAEYVRLAALVAQDLPAGAALFHSHWGAGETFADLPARQRDYMLARMKHVIAMNPILIDDTAGIARPDGIEALSRPVLLVDGAKSPAVVPQIQSRLARRLPGASRLVLPDANHMVPLTHPVPVAEAIRDLLRRS